MWFFRKKSLIQRKPTENMDLSKKYLNCIISIAQRLKRKDEWCSEIIIYFKKVIEKLIRSIVLVRD